MFAIMVHVGQTPNVRPYGMNPILSDGTFKFVKICVKTPRYPLDPTYEELGFGDLVPSEYRKSPAFNSPEFKTLTYSHINRVDGTIFKRLKQEGGYLMFYSSLFYKDIKPPINNDISSTSGAYIIGYFAIEGVYPDEELIIDTKLQERFKANGQFGSFHENGDRNGAHYWISGSSGGLLPLAVPLTSADNHLRWNEFARNNLTTPKGKPLSDYEVAKYNWTLVCPQENMFSLGQWIEKFSGVKI